MARLTKVCSSCKIEKSWDDFYLRSDRKAPKARCKVCELKIQKEYYAQNKDKMRAKSRKYAETHREQMRAYEKEWRKRPESIKKRTGYDVRRLRKNKQRAIDYKGGKCACCGYNKCRAAMEFHHTDPLKKEGETSKLKGGTWERFKKELDKCILLCSNCHRELHSGLIISEDYNE